MYLHRTRRRSGFTLVELIVAAGLTILIMSVLATGFQVGLQSLSQLKSAGDLADRIRTAETMLRLDLDAQHFGAGTTSSLTGTSVTVSSNPGTIRLSDLRFDQDTTLRTNGGFFQIRQSAPSSLEGLDQDSLSSTMATSHGISMTVRRTGKTPADLFTATDNSGGVSPGFPTVIASNPSDVPVSLAGPNLTYVSDWAEVHWFLDTSRQITQNGVATFPLCRRVRLLTKNQVTVTPLNQPMMEVISANTTTGVTNNLTSVANPLNRLTPAALPISSARFGDDIVITNVVSFEVKPTWSGGTAAAPRTSFGTGLNADFPFDDLPPFTGGVYDTFNGGLSQIRVTGVQIKIRIYDSKNQITRQSVVTSKL